MRHISNVSHWKGSNMWRCCTNCFTKSYFPWPTSYTKQSSRIHRKCFSTHRCCFKPEDRDDLRDTSVSSTTSTTSVSSVSQPQYNRQITTSEEHTKHSVLVHGNEMANDNEIAYENGTESENKMVKDSGNVSLLEKEKASIYDHETLQVVNLVKGSYTKNGVVTQEKQRIVMNYFENYYKMGEHPPWDGLAQLSFQLELNFRQIYSIMRKMTLQVPSQDSKTSVTFYPLALQSGGKITAKTKDVVRNWLKFTNYAAPNENECFFLAQVCGISLTQLRGLLRRLRDPRGKLTHRAKSLIWSWYVKNGKRLPNKTEIIELKEMSGLNYFQLREQFRIMKIHHGMLTHEKKQLFPQLLKDNDYELIPTNRLQTLAQRMKLSPNQIYRQLYLLKNAPTKQVTSQHKKMIMEALDKYDKEDSSDMYDELQKKTGLSRSQLHSQVRLLRESTGGVTSTAKAFVRDWLQEHDFKRPTDEERDSLMSHTGLSSSQLSTLLFNLREDNGKITSEKEAYLKDWISVHERPPQHSEVKSLSEALHLSRKQIYYLTQKILNPPGEITEESKEIVKKWLMENRDTKPNREQKQELLSKTGWNSEQLTYQLRQLRSVIYKASS